MKNARKLITSTMKLEKRIMLYITLVIIIFGILISVWLILSNENQILTREINNISLLTENITDKYNTFFSDRFELGKLLNASLKSRVITKDNPPSSFFNRSVIKRGEDGSVRIDDGLSGAFLSINSEITDQFLKHYFMSQRSFELIGDIAQSHFYDYYFITKYNFIRVKPSQWAMEIEADHDFSNDMFYRVADPVNNPDKEAVWTPIYYDSILKRWMTSLIVPVYDNDEFIGVTGSDLFLDTIFNNVMLLKQEHNLFDVFMFDSNANLLVHPEYKDLILNKTASMNTPLNINDLNDPILNEIIKINAEKDHLAERIQSFKKDSDTHYFHSKKIASTDWTIVIHVSRSEILKKFNLFIFKILLLSTVLAIIIIIILRAYLKHLILHRLATLGNALQNISVGELDTPIKIVREDEIGILEKGFINMQSSLKNKFKELKLAEEELRESESRYRNYINNAPDGIFIADENGKYLMVNKAACKITGYSEEELLQKHIPELIPPDYLESTSEHFQKTKNEGMASGEIPFLTKSGELRYWQVDAVKISENRFLGFTNDITQKKKSEMELKKYKTSLEDIVAERTRELEEKNKKLAEFNKLFIGREFRIKELKDKIEKLEEELNG